MKTNRIWEVMKNRACAYCGSGSTQNGVLRFIGSDSRRIRLCNSCVITLRRKSSGEQLCGLCDRHAKYATWELETVKSFGDLSFSEGNYLPEFWLLCEKHFSYLYRASQMRVKQRQLRDY